MGRPDKDHGNAAGAGDARDRLDRVLGKLAAVPRPATPEGRPLDGSTPGGLIAALLTEIDESIRPRRLVVSAGSGEALLIDCYDRRFLRLRSPTPVAPDLADKPIETEADIRALGAALTTFAKAAGGLTLRAAPMPEGHDPARLGPTARTLAAAWGLALDRGVTAVVPLDALIAAIGPTARGWVRMSPKGIEVSGGSADAIARLSDFVANGMPTVAPDVSPRCVVLGGLAGAPEGEILVAATDHEDRVLLLLPRAALPEVTAAWRRVAG